MHFITLLQLGSDGMFIFSQVLDPGSNHTDAPLDVGLLLEAHIIYPLQYLTLSLIHSLSYLFKMTCYLQLQVPCLFGQVSLSSFQSVFLSQ